MSEIASAYVSLLPSARGFGSRLESEVGGEVNSAGSKLGKGFGKVFAAGAGLIAAAGIGSLLSGSVDEAREAQKVGALTESIIKSTGGAAKITADQVGNLAGAISAKVGMDDEAIQSGANLLLTFKKIRNEAGEGNKIFNRATKAATDLSAAGFGDLNGQAKMLGKALNDPIKGISALGRSGVTFTNQQQKQIKAMVESGQVLKAQKIILGEVESQVGGAAAATATAGDKAAVSMGNLKEQVGTAMLPVIDRLANVFTTKIAPAISSFITGMQTGTGAGGAFVSTMTSVAGAVMSTVGFLNQHKGVVIGLTGAVAALVVVTQAHAAVLAVQAAGGLAAMIKGLPIVTALTKTWAAVQWVLNAALSANPIGLVIVGLVALGAGLVIAYKKSETFRNIVDGAFSVIKSAASGVVSFFTTKVPAAFNTVKNAASTAINWIKGNWPLILAVLTGPFGIAAALIVKNWDKIKAGGVVVLDFIKSIPGRITDIFANVGDLLTGAGERLMNGLADGVERGLNAVKDKITSGLNWIKDKLPGSPIKDGPLKGWNGGRPGILLMDMLGDGVKKGGKKLRERMTKELDALKSLGSSLVSDMKSLADSVASAFTPDAFRGTAAEMFGALTSGKGSLDAVMGAFKSLTSMGASKDFLSNLFKSGNTGLILELAGGPASSVQEASSLFGSINTLSAELGAQVGQNQFGDQINGVRDEIRELRRDLKPLQSIGRDVGRELNNTSAKAKTKTGRKGKK